MNRSINKNIIPAIEALNKTRVSNPPPYSSLCIRYAITALYEKKNKIIKDAQVETKYAIFGFISNFKSMSHYQL
tara:strand:- start:341 stop:562 length:222 start_codon:yes stop_codon:yes gene_type:complete